MALIRSLNRLADEFRACAMAIGNFDGVHLGHAQIARRLVARARELSAAAVVFTFDPPPAQILRPTQAPPPLMWIERKAELLTALGVDAVVACPIDQAFLRIEPEEFFRDIVRGLFRAQALVEGTNFFFGRGRRGNVELLGRCCRDAGITLEVVDPVLVDGEPVSSTRIRGLVSAGRIDSARRMLSAPYRIRGTVIRGAGRGMSLGYPTANLGAVDTLLPAEGIYAGRAFVDSQRWPAAISLGPNPTFGEAALKVEAYLLDYQGDLYDRLVEVDFLTRLRDIERFASVQELLSQMEQDVAAARDIHARQPT